MKFLVEYLTKGQRDFLNYRPSFLWNERTKKIEIDNANWQNVTEKAMQNEDVHLIIAVHLHKENWLKK